MKTARRQFLAAATAFALAPALSAAALAQDDYPNKTVKLIVAAAPGGPTDLPARLASEILKNKFGQAVVVENRAGAGGAIGARAAAASAPDGYTLFMGNTSTFAVIPAVSVNPGYHPLKDFIPIIKITEGFQLLVVHPSSPWKTLKEFIDYAKANPGKINYAHTGNGGLPHLAGELFMLRTGTKLTGVAYRSGGESNTAVLSQAVHATFENIAILRTLVPEGKLRGLALQNATRTPIMKDVPTMAELGFPDSEANTFFGVAAPKGTPAAIVAKLNAALNEGLQTPEMQKTISNLGSEAKRNAPAEFSAFIETQLKKWTAVGKAAGVEIK